MQKELQEAANADFDYVGQTVFKTRFGGDEVAIILERDKDAEAGGLEYRLLAPSKTSTLQNEFLETGEAGYDAVGMTASKTALCGKELVVITSRARTQ